MAFAELSFPRLSATPTYTNLRMAELIQAEFRHDLLMIQAPPGGGYFNLLDVAHLSGSPVLFEWGVGTRNNWFTGYVDRVLPDYNDGKIGMRLACVGASYPMKEARQQVWTDVTAPQIAASIAAFYGFDSEIEPLARVYPMVSQTGESDWTLLANLAKDNGFTFFVRGTTLHFHSRQYRLEAMADRAPILTYDLQPTQPVVPTGTGNMKSFSPTVGEAATRKRMVTSGVDPYLGFAHQSAHEGVAPQLGSTTMAPIFTEYTLATTSGIGNAQDQLAGAQEDARWHLSAKAQVIGDPALAPSSLAYLYNLPGSYSGYWWASGTRHLLTASKATRYNDMAYWTDLELGRDGLEGTTVPPTKIQQRLINLELDGQGTVTDKPSYSLLDSNGTWRASTLGLAQPQVEPVVPAYLQRRLSRVHL